MLVRGLFCCLVLSLMVEGQSTNLSNRRRPLGSRARYRSRQAYSVNSAQTRRATPTSEGSPQSWRDLVQMNGGVSNVDDFIRLLVTPDGRRVTEGDIFSPYETEDGKRMITGGGIMPTSDECSPRNMSVRLPLNYSDTQVAYYPECTKVRRCGGCTPTPFLSCEPLYKEKIVFKVLRARYLYPGAFSMRWEGFSSVEVEQHLSCRAVCNLEPNDCGPNQRFNPYQCKCQCVRYMRCFNEKVWDPEECRCRCPNEGPCCAEDGEEDDRTCTSYFDRDFCECTLKTSIGFSANSSQSEIEAWLASRRNPNNRNNPNNPNDRRVHISGMHNAVSTPRPTTASSSADCSRLSCPSGFHRTLNPQGNCVCVFSAARRGRPRRRG